jgi:DNA-binding GntR family transcriptional regulator
MEFADSLQRLMQKVHRRLLMVSYAATRRYHHHHHHQYYRYYHIKDPEKAEKINTYSVQMYEYTTQEV